MVEIFFQPTFTTFLRLVFMLAPREEFFRKIPVLFERLTLVFDIIKERPNHFPPSLLSVRYIFFILISVNSSPWYWQNDFARSKCKCASVCTQFYCVESHLNQPASWKKYECYLRQHFSVMFKIWSRTRICVQDHVVGYRLK